MLIVNVQISVKADQPELYDVAVKFTIITSMMLTSSLVNRILFSIAFASDDLVASDVSFLWWQLDRIINIMALVFSMPTGTKYYDCFCHHCHHFLVQTDTVELHSARMTGKDTNDVIVSASESVTG